MTVHRREVEFVQSFITTEHGETIGTFVYRTALGEPLVLVLNEADTRWLSADMADKRKANGWDRDSV